MFRRLLLFHVLAVAALPAAASAAAPTDEVQTPYAKFALDANHGLRAFVEAAEGDVTLELNRKHYTVTYKVPAEITDTGLKAQFGKLGLIDVAFQPTKTLRTEEPPKGCEGEPSTHREGLFVGTIEFAGEHEYVQIESTQAEGKMSVYRESEWKCPHKTRSTRGEGPPTKTSAGARARYMARKEPAALSALSRRCLCYFLALAEHDREGRGPTYFLGAKLEHREGMEISRVTYAGTGTRVGTSSFVFDHEAGTATVRPPWPFSGHATFERRRHGRDLWQSTIRVPVLGAAPLSIRGQGFRAKLVRDLPGD
jgi:hypothetical protein